LPKEIPFLSHLKGTGSQIFKRSFVVDLEEKTGKFIQFHKIYAKSGSFCVIILPGSPRFFHQRHHLFNYVILYLNPNNLAN